MSGWNLLPCPLCGSRDLSVSLDGGITPHYFGPSDECGIVGAVMCESCGCRVEGWDDGICDPDAAREDTCRRWNSRVTA